MFKRILTQGFILKTAFITSYFSAIPNKVDINGLITKMEKDYLDLKQEKHYKSLGNGLKINKEPHSKYAIWGKQGNTDSLSQTETILKQHLPYSLYYVNTSRLPSCFCENQGCIHCLLFSACQWFLTSFKVGCYIDPCTTTPYILKCLWIQEGTKESSSSFVFSSIYFFVLLIPPCDSPYSTPLPSVPLTPFSVT